MTHGKSVVVPREPTEAMIEAAFDAFEIDRPKQYRDGNEARLAIWSAMLAAAPGPSSLAGGEVEKACAVFQEAIDYFEADVADALAEDSERADLWDREVTVNIDALKTVMNAALTPRHEAPEPRPELAPYTEELKGIKAAMLANEAPAEGAGERVRVLEVLMSEHNASDLSAIVHSDPSVSCLAASRMVTRILSALRPAAPSADKLRIAVEALEPFANLGVSSGPDDEPCHYAYRITRGAIRNARQALAALKAEGA